ncbi:MAG: leucine-rich repeat domain-containing protein [Acholeplasmataceae bacterium]|nr:leucine-rich repeat domain-containing protein [Acholeplasmataceae bacterium]
MISSMNYVKEKTNKLLKSCNDKKIFSDANLIYDYNEVLELFYSTQQPVFINGSTKLKKTELLHQVVKELGDHGYSANEVIYIDCRVPFLRDLNVIELIDKENIKFIAINEIQELLNFAEVIDYFYKGFSNIKLIATCSVPELLYEIQHDKYSNLKIVVLSEKNKSNIKIDQVTFGVFENLKYNIKNDVCEIKGMTKEGKLKTRHFIPESIEGYPVKIIASGAFHHRTELVEIILPDTIEYIGDYAFTYCNSLIEIVLPKALKYIGDCSFLGAKRLQTITGGENITHIGHSALYGTEWLKQQKGDFAILGKTIYKCLSTDKEVVIPKDILTLGNYAFSNSRIKNVKLSNQELGEGVFYNCQELEEVIGFKETKIPSYSFYNCKSLKIEINNIFEVGSFSFYNCKSIEKIAFSKCAIENNAFENCKNLKFPLGSIQRVEVGSFYDSGVINIDQNETFYIDEFAFAFTHLVDQHVDKVLQVESYAFMNINTLKEISISKNAIIGKGVLYGSENIIKASIGGQYPLRYYFLKESKIVELVVLSSTCDNFARDNKMLRKLKLNGDKIGDWAFYNNSNLVDLQISTNNLGNWSFARCEKLSEVKIPKQVEYVKMNCFRYCENLNKIIIDCPNLVSFGANAFYSTGTHKKILVHNKKRYLNSELWKEYADNLVDIKE